MSLHRTDGAAAAAPVSRVSPGLARVIGVVGIAGLVASACMSTPQPNIAAGRRLAHDWQKGNCLACHKIPADAQAATLADIGPPLQDLKARYPRREDLRAQIWDARERNAQTVMPPFGTARILTAAEIDKIIDYLYAY